MTDDDFDPSAARPLSSARSDVGRVRSVNEDLALARFPLYFVADGMGGHERGDRASRTAIDTLEALLPGSEPVSPAELLEAVRSANTAVCALRDPITGALSGTTLTGLAVVRAESGELLWMVINVGDSRVYRWSGRTLTQLTIDHSVVQELVDAGEITQLEAERHPERNTITRALGAADEVEIDAWLLPYSGAATYLICSDGVTKELGLFDIEKLLSGHGDPDRDLADSIVQAALDAGGRDNVTAIVVESGELAEASALSTERRDHVFEFDDTHPRGSL
ncbi:protein phosphatase 2C domain-containing protein [Schumannella luteola]|uniref:Serine/threonine protein phosphatase PrpC n=1 Tax=Schumannella luteola TaxID=472059 RepID=A0A852YIF2_9MICO|nr:protein phosphatase 2C domain-containing protein [Schumannella luteola]NYG98888.1 serine/threonine protein phosphatase PrpC [Schumannella luteola]TPX06269.1 serine/threonine-protein phosphatase [Schumannella luteola]